MMYLVKKFLSEDKRPNSDEEIHVVATMFSQYDSVQVSKGQNIIQTFVNVTKFDNFDEINFFITTYFLIHQHV